MAHGYHIGQHESGLTLERPWMTCSRVSHFHRYLPPKGKHPPQTTVSMPLLCLSLALDYKVAKCDIAIMANGESAFQGE